MDLLPDEIFELICSYLSAVDLLQMTLVCRYSKWIIENSPSLMKKLPILIFDNDDNENVDFDDNNKKLIEPLMASNKKVRSVIVHLRNEKIMKYFGIFKTFGDSIQYLEIKSYAFETLDQLRIILRYATKLTHLTLTNLKIRKSENEILNSITRMPKLNLGSLTHLDIINCDLKIFSLFVNNSSVQLNEIRLRVNEENDVDSQVSLYDDFFIVMSHQRKLVKLTLDGISNNDNDILKPLNNSNLCLYNLDVKNYNFDNRDSARSFIEFVKSQKFLKSLKILNSPISTQIDNIYMYRNIFCNYIEEATLDIDENSMIHSHNFFNCSVRKLNLKGNFAFENLPIFINLIKIFPYVSEFKIEGQSPINEKYLLNILIHFRHLEKLHVPGFTSRTGDSNFANLHTIENQLKTLTLEYIDNDVKFFGWKNIVTNLNSIEKLIIKRDYGKVSNEIVDMIVKKLKLKHLELGIGVVSEDIMKTITQSSYCSRLKVLKISKNDIDKLPNQINFDDIIRNNQLLLYLCDEKYFVNNSKLPF